MVYDSGRKRAVLFGGADASEVRGDTWEWDGRKWTQVATLGPGPRTFPAMAYDSVRHRVILFGGNRVLFGRDQNDNRYLNDTWEWNGHTWYQINVSGPSPRAEAVMVFDTKRGRSVLFGGHTITQKGRNWLGDTWEWDGIRWRQVAISGPSPRNGAAAVYDTVRGRIVLFGGSTQDGVSGETWEWDGLQWTKNVSATTEGRFNCVMAYDEILGRVIRFGGRYGGNAFGDTWDYDGKQWTRLGVAGPSARNHSALVYDSQRRKMVLFGGHDLTNVFGDTWELDDKNWRCSERGRTEKRVENGH